MKTSEDRILDSRRTSKVTANLQDTG